MWVLKAKVPSHSKQLIASRTKKYGITLIGYPVSHYLKNNRLFVTAVGHMVGDEKNKKEFIDSSKKDQRVKRIEVNKNIMVACFEQHKAMKVLYNPNIFFISPIIATAQGGNVFELASWEKEPLQKLAKLFLSEDYKGKIISFKKQKINNVFSLRAIPPLTERQSRAFELAVQNGYYEYPRKIDLQQLAKMMKISYTTYHFHLRTAEKKLMPLLLK